VPRNLTVILLAIALPAGGRPILAQEEPAGAAEPSLAVGEIWRSDDGLHFAVETAGLFDAETRRTIEQGGTAALDFFFELYRERRGWFDSRVYTLEVLPFRVTFDSFERQYRVLSTDIRLRTDDFDQVVEQCTHQADVFMGTLDDLRLDPEATYYIVARARYQPMAVETIDEIRTWVGGSGDRDQQQDRRRDDRGAGVGSRLARVLMSAAGFGEQELSGESRRFRPADLPER